MKQKGQGRWRNVTRVGGRNGYMRGERDKGREWERERKSGG